MINNLKNCVEVRIGKLTLTFWKKNDEMKRKGIHFYWDNIPEKNFLTGEIIKEVKRCQKCGRRFYFFGSKWRIVEVVLGSKVNSERARLVEKTVCRKCYIKNKETEEALKSMTGVTDVPRGING